METNTNETQNQTEARKYELQANRMMGVGDTLRFEGMYETTPDMAREAGLLYEKAYHLGGNNINLFRAEWFLRVACDLEFMRDHRSIKEYKNTRSHEDLVRVCIEREF